MSLTVKELKGSTLHEKIDDISKRFDVAVNNASISAGSDVDAFYNCLNEEISQNFSLEEIMCIRRFVNENEDSIMTIFVVNDIRRVRFIKLVASIINTT